LLSSMPSSISTKWIRWLIRLKCIYNF
jgi:hypothetical protein